MGFAIRAGRLHTGQAVPARRRGPHAWDALAWQADGARKHLVGMA